MKPPQIFLLALLLIFLTACNFDGDSVSTKDILFDSKQDDVSKTGSDVIDDYEYQDIISTDSFCDTTIRDINEDENIWDIDHSDIVVFWDIDNSDVRSDIADDINSEDQISGCTNACECPNSFVCQGGICTHFTEAFGPYIFCCTDPICVSGTKCVEPTGGFSYCKSMQDSGIDIEDTSDIYIEDDIVSYPDNYMDIASDIYDAGDPTAYCSSFNIPYGELDGTGCQIPIGHRDYCATCGPCKECYGMCVRYYQCESGLDCIKGKCVDPKKL